MPMRATLRNPHAHLPLGAVVAELGFATRDDVGAALVLAHQRHHTLSRVLLDEGIVTPAELTEALARRYGVPRLSPGSLHVSAEASGLLSGESARRLRVVPIDVVDADTVLVAIDDPSNELALGTAAKLTGRPVRVALCGTDEMESLLAAAEVTSTAGWLTRRSGSPAQGRDRASTSS